MNLVQGRKKSVVLQISETDMPVACVNVREYGIVILSLDENSLRDFISKHVKGFKVDASPDTEEYDVEAGETEKVE